MSSEGKTGLFQLSAFSTTAMLFAPPGCLAVPKTCYPDRICSCSFLAVLGRVASEHLWPKKKLEHLSVTNQFIERLTEFVTLTINLHFSKYSEDHCISEVIFVFRLEAALCPYFFFFSGSSFICLWCRRFFHSDSDNWYRALFPRREAGKTLMSLIIRIFVVTVFAPTSVRLI